MKEILQTKLQEEPNHNGDLLEHILMNSDSNHKRNQTIQEARLIQNEKHKEIDHTLAEHQLLLTNKSNKLQEQTIKTLEQLLGKIDKLSLIFKDLSGDKKPKNFGLPKTGEKKKLILDKEIIATFKELKTRINHYKLLLSYLKTGK